MDRERRMVIGNRVAYSLGLCLLLAQTVHANFFDTFVSYRQGTGNVNIDTSTRPFDTEPDVPFSTDNVFAYTQSNSEDGSIDVVHAYSMRNGLFGSPKEVRIYWTHLDFSQPDYHRRGHATNTRIVSMPITKTIDHFAVYETDLTAFLLSQTRNQKVILNIVPGPSVKERPLRTYTFWPDGFTDFNINELLLLPEAKKAIFYSQNHIGEIGLEHYPFEDTDALLAPTIKIYKVHGPKQFYGDNPDFSVSCQLLQI